MTQGENHGKGRERKAKRAQGAEKDGILSEKGTEGKE
jgi:hypothetical protein